MPYISEMSPGDLPNLPYISPMWCESVCNGGEVADLDDFAMMNLEDLDRVTLVAGAPSSGKTEFALGML